jgi:hypothetical protein
MRCFEREGEDERKRKRGESGKRSETDGLHIKEAKRTKSRERMRLRNVVIALPLHRYLLSLPFPHQTSFPFSPIHSFPSLPFPSLLFIPSLSFPSVPFAHYLLPPASFLLPCTFSLSYSYLYTCDPVIYPIAHTNTSSGTFLRGARAQIKYVTPVWMRCREREGERERGRDREREGW